MTEVLTTAGNTTLEGVWGYASYIPRQLTSYITDFLISKNIQVTPRWTSTLILFFTFALFYIGLKISKPAIKWILIILAVALIIGILVPYW